jgi:prepilin-type N-terminal cleavage/methylation domain-containing protein/prepilin-type processing-associated H-X9-DG protein
MPNPPPAVRRPRAFTLIELLVVIAIIAILAAILFPVFAQAREKARQSACLSNMKQMGLSLMQYKQDYDETFPTAYYHRAFNPASGGTAAGYIHWSALVQPYIKNWGVFVCPSDRLGGHAPTCFSSATNNGGFGYPDGQLADQCGGGSIVDDQAPRLSYTANSAVLPRFRNILDQNSGVQVVPDALINAPANTIALAELSDYLSCLNGTSLGTPVRNSSHRSVNAYAVDASGGRYLGENTDSATSPLYAMPYATVKTRLDACQGGSGATTDPLLTYAGYNRHSGGSNFAFADGHAKWFKLDQTMNQNSWMWGAKNYGHQLQQPILRTDGSGQPVNPQ